MGLQCIHTHTHTHTHTHIHPEDGSKNTKHVAESCKFIKYLIQSYLDYILLYYLIKREQHKGDSLP
jgi:hypothetical protein